MALGAAVGSARQPTVVDNAGVSSPDVYRAGSQIPVFLLGTGPTQMNGVYDYYANRNYYKPLFNGSQVIYVVTGL